MSNNKKDSFVLHWKTKDERKLFKDQNLIYVPVAYLQACFDIVRRHNPRASKEEIYAEYDRCLQLAKKHNFPTKAILSLFCYGYFCPSDINIKKEKPLNIKEKTIDMTNLPEKNKLKSSDVFIVIMGIAAICIIISNIMEI